MKYIKNELKNRTIDRSIMDYQINDFIICNTNKQKDEYTLRYTGMFDKEKYNITSNNYTGYSNGEIIIASDELKHVKTKEIRHGFTIHSIQGETAENKLFIDTRRITSSQMIYTALSRARRFDQVYLLK
jgi:ATP-dependent exoDNAse (exonuclease V) alpha subunit